VSPSSPRVLGVTGAGTMGAGIAQVACLGGFETYLHDPFPDALERGLAAVRAGLEKGAERGRWSAAEAEQACARVHAAREMDELAPCDIVIEAAPENLEVKRELFERLSEVCAPDAVLATNTSSLPVTALATAAARPERVVGMHFFNPVVLMDLLEVVAGIESAPEAIEVARDAGERMGKRVIVARDGPGFLANRCARPFGLEGLKLLSEGVAGHDAIDRIVRMAGGFRMGPFELADLVGIDVGFEVSKSFWEQSFHEPRWRPSMIQARMVQAGRLGRKTGRGYYGYGTEGGQATHRPDDPGPPTPGGEGVVAVAGEGRIAEDLRDAIAQAGYDVLDLESNGDSPQIVVDAVTGRSPLDVEPVIDDPSTLVLVLCVDGSLAELDVQGGAVGFHALPPFEDSRLVEVTRSAETSARDADRAERFFNSLGKQVEWVGDAPGLVLGRIVCQLVNEAAFAVAEDIGTPADVDTAMRHGYNYPRGPLEWADTIELDHVLATLDALHGEQGEERYRAAPLLRRMVAEGHLGEATGRGFFEYD
jgi:3-hydroxybutyryl-CoA dehydrogenase